MIGFNRKFYIIDDFVFIFVVLAPIVWDNQIRYAIHCRFVKAQISKTRTLSPIGLRINKCGQAHTKSKRDASESHRNHVTRWTQPNKVPKTDEKNIVSSVRWAKSRKAREEDTHWFGVEIYLCSCVCALKVLPRHRFIKYM